MKQVIWLVLFACLPWAQNAFASESDQSAISDAPSVPQLKDESQSNRIRMSLAGEYSMLKSSAGVSLSGVGAGAAFSYGFNQRWGLGIGVAQVFDSRSFSVQYTRVEIRGICAVTGSLISESREVSIDQVGLMSSRAKNSGGVRFQIAISEYFLNGTSAIIPFSGVGVGLGYELPSLSNYNYFFGVRADQLTNGKLSLQPIQVLVGLGFWI